MADVKISALPTTTTTAAGDVYPLVQGGVTKHIDFDDIVDSIPDADGSTTGLLTSTDWTTFNNKQATLSIGTIDSVAKSGNGAVLSGASLVNQTADATNPGLVSTGTQTIAGNKTLQGESPTVGNALVVQNSTPTAKLTVANAGRVTVGQDSTVTTEVCAVITTDVTNANLVIAPNGTGAIIADIPDGAVSGGNARGTNAVDLQIERSNAAYVVSGSYSFLGGGSSNTVSANRSVCGGGDFNVVNGTYSTVAGGRSNTSGNSEYCTVGGGQGNTASAGHSSIVGGNENTAAGSLSSISGGFRARTALYGQRANASGYFAANSDAQTSALTFRRSITGTAQAELFLDGASVQAILALPTGATNARMWTAMIQVSAIVATQGAGTAALNECFAGTYQCAIKRVGANTSMIGNVTPTSELSDTNMVSSIVTIDADDTNEALRIQFTPPTTAAADTVIRVVATAYLTEVGR
jgi:hypothetical protein